MLTAPISSQIYSNSVYTGPYQSGSSGGGGGGVSTPSFDPLSISGGQLLLASATFSDATIPIVSSASETYQGLQVVMQGSATATINDLTESACWTWELDGGDAVNLTERASVITVLERLMSVYPSLCSVYCVFTDNGDPKVATGNGWGVEMGWPSTTFRRIEYLARASSGWTRTINASGVDAVHFGAD
jgi:hypothetical protein